MHKLVNIAFSDVLNVLSDLSALRSPLHAAESADHVVFSWYEEESSSSEGSSNKFSEGVVCSLYHILFQCSNKSPGLVNFLMAMVSRYKEVQDSNLNRLYCICPKFKVPLGG